MRNTFASLPALRVEVWSDRLRADPHFQDLLRRMNFPQYIHPARSGPRVDYLRLARCPVRITPDARPK
jgi:hypothetical protein